MHPVMTDFPIFEDKEGVWVFNRWFILLQTNFTIEFINLGNQFYNVEKQSKLKHRKKTNKK